MTKLLPTFFACMILAIISERCSIREEGKLEYLHKDKIFYFMIVVLMIFLAGLRVRYNDTATYISAYEFRYIRKHPFKYFVEYWR